MPASPRYSAHHHPDPARLLTLAEAARILRVRDSVARTWLEDHDLVINIAGRLRVSRTKLLRALDGGLARPEDKPPERRQLRRPTPQTDAF
jgi:hypothetical protein